MQAGIPLDGEVICATIRIMIKAILRLESILLFFISLLVYLQLCGNLKKTHLGDL